MTPAVLVDIGPFKRAIAGRLGPSHPLSLILRRTADKIPATELRARVGDFVTLLEAA